MAVAVLLLALLTVSASHGQEPSGSKSEPPQAAAPGQTTAPLVQAPPVGTQPSEEKHPRLFGILPTYTVANAKSPAMLTTGGKWRLFVRDKTDPFTFGWVAFEAGIAQANNDLAGYGQGAAGYGKRLGAGMADEVAGGFFGTFLFASLLHQDPRYHRLGGGPFKQRLGHALVRPLVTRKDSGGRAFNWSGLCATVARSSLSNAYYPEEDRGVGETFSRVGMSIPFQMIDRLVDEFGPDLEKKFFGKR